MPVNDETKKKMPKVLRLVPKDEATSTIPSKTMSEKASKLARRDTFPKDRDELIEAYDAEEERIASGLSAPDTDEDRRHDARHPFS